MKEWIIGAALSAVVATIAWTAEKLLAIKEWLTRKVG